jgi:hypothetical protein
MWQISETAITYVPRPGTAPGTELSILAQVYKFVLESRKAVEPTPKLDSQDAERSSSDGVTGSIQRGK